MKILQLVKYYSPSRGGMESVVKNIVEGISSAESNCEFTVYSNSHIPNYKKGTVTTQGVRIIKEFTPFLFKSQPLNLRYPSLKELIISHDIIHHHYPFPNMELALLRNMDALVSKKVIITWHANIKNSRWSFIRKYYNPLIRKLLDRADSIVVTSPQLFESSDILSQYENKIKVIPLSFDPLVNGNQVQPRIFNENKTKNILFVGKLRSYKGLKYLVQAIFGLDVTLTIVGDGEEKPNLQKQVDELGLNNRVRFFSNVGDDDLILKYKEADLFVLPSINEAEAFGVVQLEAMAHGLPVINTKLDSGVPYVSLNGVSGLTVSPKNAEELSKAITEIFSDKGLYEKFSANSLERSKLFSREKLASSYLELYNL